MAILRGGRRIGNYDIRIGLPRDRSLVDVAKDPRLQRRPGGSGTIQRFLSQVNQGEGFSRTNRPDGKLLCEIFSLQVLVIIPANILRSRRLRR